MAFNPNDTVANIIAGFAARLAILEAANSTPPTGKLFLTDPDGAILTDPDGAYLLETL